MYLSRAVSAVCLWSIFSLGLTVSYANATVYRVDVEDIIHGINARHVVSVIERANAENASLVLVRIQTPGGLDTSMREIIEAILNSQTPVAVYVAPSGARAASAGFLITIAADIAVMAPSTNMGAATPVSLISPEKRNEEGKLSQETAMERKVRNDAAAYIRSIATKRDRNPELAEKGVTEALSWTEDEALAAGLIDFIASSESELLQKLDGQAVKRIDGPDVVLKTVGESVVTVEMSWQQRILAVIANPNLAMLLGMAGLLGLYLEFSNPGSLIPGILGALCLLMAAFALQILPVNIVGLILLAGGVCLLVAEVLTPSFGIMGIGGIVAVVLGGLMLFEEQEIPTPALQVSWALLLPMAVGFGGLFILIGRMVVSSQSRPPVTGSESLISMLATARTEIEKEGKIFIRGEFWDAYSTERIAAGEKVKVVDIDGLMLRVEPVREV